MIRITFEFETSDKAKQAIDTVQGILCGPAPTEPPTASEIVTPEQLNDAMVQATMKLNDNGSACVGILNSYEVKSISQLTPEQLPEVLKEVRAL